MMYDYKVLGIDSSAGNTQSAMKRSRQLEKQWSGLLKNATLKREPTEESGPNEVGSSAASDQSNMETSVDKPVTSIHNSRTFMPVTQFVTPDTDILGLFSSYFETLSEEAHVNGESTESEEAISAKNIEDLGKLALSENVMITGLHTCGNLATSILKLFVSNSDAKIMCNVGCCYNHIDEEFLRNPFLDEGTLTC